VTEVSFYHRLLRLRHYRPGRVMTVVLFEGSIVVPALLWLADILEWWGVLVIPVAVAGLVKFNDLVAGLPYRSREPGSARGTARVRRRPAVD
jgi:hypothetical protein